jgi:hypothetical protein
VPSLRGPTSGMGGGGLRFGQALALARSPRRHLEPGKQFNAQRVPRGTLRDPLANLWRTRMQPGRRAASVLVGLPGLEPGTSSLSGFCPRACYRRIAPATCANDLPLETAGDRCEPLGSDGVWTTRGPGTLRSRGAAALRVMALAGKEIPPTAPDTRAPAGNRGRGVPYSLCGGLSSSPSRWSSSNLR